MRILVTNDDGINAQGLKVCEEIARKISDDVWVVAPEHDQSGVSHSLSLNDPLRLRQIGERHYAVKGTPTDCVIMAARNIMPERPDLVLSGVNRGRNAAEDVLYSGTIAAAKEACVLGIPSFALSQAFTSASKQQPHWKTATEHAPDIIRRVLEQGIPRDVLVNVNFPGLPARRGEGHFGRDPGQARCAAAAHRRAPRRPRQSVLLDRLCARREAGRQERHRSRRARRRSHLDHAAAPRSHRPAVPDEARGAVSQASRGASMRAAANESEQRMEFMLTLRRRGISDKAVLRAMDEVPREHFVEARFADSAYADQAMPIACGQTISQPYVVAYMTEQLAVRAEPSRARGRHRLGLSGGGAVAARPRGGDARALPHAWPTARGRG